MPRRNRRAEDQPIGDGPHPTPEQSAALADSFDRQHAESRDRNTNPPAPDIQGRGHGWPWQR